MNKIDQGDHVVDGRRRQNSVAKVENVAWPARRKIQELLHLFTHLRDRSEKDLRIEIPLNGPIVTDHSPGLVERPAMVDAANVAAGLAEFF